MTRSINPQMIFAQTGTIVVSSWLQLAFATTVWAADPSVLQGGVNDKEHLEPSVRLTIPTPEVQKPHDLNVKQFSGSAPYAPGTPAPPVPRPVVPARVFSQPITPPFMQGNVNDRFRRTVFVPSVPPPPTKWNYTMTPKNGIMTWTPGYETKNITSLRPAIRATILNVHPALSLKGVNGNLLNTNVSLSTHALSATPLLLGGSRSSVASQMVHAPELKATQLAMPKPKQTWRRTANWNDWYKQIATAVFQEWRQSDTQAGVATVRVKVFRSCDIDCELAAFEPAKDLKRDATREVSFKEAAVRSVDDLNRSPVWQFPDIDPLPKQVIIDLEMKRKVGGAAGCAVTRARNGQ